MEYCLFHKESQEIIRPDTLNNLALTPAGEILSFPFCFSSDPENVTDDYIVIPIAPFQATNGDMILDGSIVLFASSHTKKVQKAVVSLDQKHSFAWEIKRADGKMHYWREIRHRNTIKSVVGHVFTERKKVKS